MGLSFPPITVQSYAPNLVSGQTMTIHEDYTCNFYVIRGQTMREWVFFGPERSVPDMFEFRALYRKQAHTSETRLSKQEFEALREQQWETPVQLLSVERRRWWWYCNLFYATDEPFSDPLVIKGFIIEKKERLRRKEERARAIAVGVYRPFQSRGWPGAGKAERATAQQETSPYTLLDISPQASFEEIKQAYRKRITEYHPDKVAMLGPELRRLAEEMTKKINDAFLHLEKLHREEYQAT